MGISVFPAVTGGIKSIQRGVTTVASTVAITAVNTSKAFVTSYSDSSTGNVSGVFSSGANAFRIGDPVNFGTTWATRQNGAYLVSSTHLYTSGATRWQIVEFN